mgnify:FL=1|tara:strand:- start:8971 stop:9213 length:243 start_codon:yes stop_codon:yes gene_type:complete
MVTLNKDGTPRKKGSGKTKGSTSFVEIKLSTLKNLVKDGVTIPVSRKWLNALGYKESSVASNKSKEESSDKVEFTITNFE